MIVQTGRPKGQQRVVTFTAAIQDRSPRPLRFAGFKAGYRNANIEKVFKTFDPCEIDSSKCDDPLDQPENAKALNRQLPKWQIKLWSFSVRKRLRRCQSLTQRASHSTPPQAA